MIASTDAIEKIGILGGFLLGLTGAIISVLTARAQRSDHKLQTLPNRRAALEFELMPRDVGGAFLLRAHNLGAHPARDVIVEGAHDSGVWHRPSQFKEILPGSNQGFVSQTASGNC